MKNAFYFTSKALFVFKKFNFLPWLFGHVEKRLNLKAKINFKTDDVTTWQQTIAILILNNISQSKFSQVMKFGQLIGYNMRIIFLEKSYTNGGGESIPQDPFLKNQNWVYLWINSLKIYTVCFYSTLSCGYRDILKLSYRSLAFTSCKAFFKNKKRSRTSLPTSFSVWFFKRSYLVIFY